MKSPSSPAHRSRLPLLVLGVTLVCLARLLLPLLPGLSAADAWHAADVLRPIGMGFALAAVLCLLPWAELRLCCIVAALVGYHVADAALCALWYFGARAEPNLWMAVQVSVSLYWGALYLWRSYDAPSDPLDHGHVFCLRHRPQKLQDLLLSMLGCFGAQGAYAIYAAGHVYHFRKGRLVATVYDPRYFANYVVTRGRPLQLQHIVALDNMRGVKWSPLTNCVTLLGTFWRRHGR